MKKRARARARVCVCVCVCVCVKEREKERCTAERKREMYYGMRNRVKENALRFDDTVVLKVREKRIDIRLRTIIDIRLQER